MDVQECCILFRGDIYCSGWLYAVQGGYMLYRWVMWMFRRVVYCSGGLYAVQEGYMIKKIIMVLVVTNIVAS